MTFLEGIRELMLSDGTLSGLIGTRIYPVVLPQNPTLPALTLQQISGIRDVNLSTVSSLAAIRMQCDCWASTYRSMEAVANAMRAALNGYKGQVGGSPPVINIGGIFFENERDTYESDTKLYRRSVDYIIWANDQ